MNVNVLIDGIESKIRELEYSDNDLSDAINKTQYYLSGYFIDDKLKNKFTDYITEYSKSYYFSQRDPAFKQLIAQDDMQKSYYTNSSGRFVWWNVFTASFLSTNYAFNPKNFEDLLITVIASLGASGIAKYIESQNKYVAKKFFNMPGREDIFGSVDYNKALRKDLIKQLKTSSI